MERKYITTTEQQTKDVAISLANELGAGSIVLLSGDLGAGKTVFAKGFAIGLGVSDEVASPTFTIMNAYNNLLYHFDLYRLSSYDEFLATGAEEYLYANGYCLIEWPECVGIDCFPMGSVRVNIKKVDENSREITISGGN